MQSSRGPWPRGRRAAQSCGPKRSVTKKSTVCAAGPSRFAQNPRPNPEKVVCLAFAVRTEIALERRYLYGNAVDQILAQEDVTVSESSADRVLWPLVDNLQTVRDLAKNDGTLGEHYKYDSFGQVLSGDTSVTRYLFTSREFDEDTGLQYSRARWYDPAAGRWISEDSLGFAGRDTNLYRYVANRATIAIDPSGYEQMTMTPVADAVEAGVFPEFIENVLQTPIGGPQETIQNYPGGTNLTIVPPAAPGEPRATLADIIDLELRETNEAVAEALAYEAIGYALGPIVAGLARIARAVGPRMGPVLGRTARPVHTSGELSVPQRVYTATDVPVDLNRPRGTFVTQVDITEPRNLVQHVDLNVPPNPAREGGLPRYVNEIATPQGSVLPDPTVRFRPNDPTGWIPPQTPGAQLTQLYEVAEDAVGNIIIRPVQPPRQFP